MAFDPIKFKTMMQAKFPNMTKQQQAIMEGAIQQKTVELLATPSAGLSPKDVPTDPIAQAMLLNQVQSGSYKDPESVKAAQKLQNEGKGVLGLIDTLKQYYNQPNAEGMTPVAGKENLSKGVPGQPRFLADWGMKAKIAFNVAPDAATYKRMKEGFTASLKEATGDTGVLTDKDYDRIAKTMPEFGDDDLTAQKAWEAVDQILMAKFGRVGKFSYLPKEKVPVKAGQGSRFTIEAIE